MDQRCYISKCALIELDGVHGFNEDLYLARPIIEEKVNSILATRKKLKYEYPGDFKANVAFCNL